MGTVGPQIVGYTELALPAVVADSCPVAWTHAPASPEVRHRVLPDAGFGVGFRRCTSPLSAADDPRIVLIGGVSKPRLLSVPVGYRMTAVRVNVEWVRPLFGVHPADHLNVERDLADVLPSLNRALLPSLIRATSEHEVIGILMRAIEDRLAAASPPQDVHHALALVRAARGLTQVESVARACGRSVRHLRRVVSTETGMPLKAYARNVRFLYAVTLADQMRDPNWAEIAIRSGYCDQSHLIRDAQAIAHATPTCIHRERRAER